MVVAVQGQAELAMQEAAEEELQTAAAVRLADKRIADAQTLSQIAAAKAEREQSVEADRGAAELHARVCCARACVCAARACCAYVLFCMCGACVLCV